MKIIKYSLDSNGKPHCFQLALLNRDLKDKKICSHLYSILTYLSTEMKKKAEHSKQSTILFHINSTFCLLILLYPVKRKITSLCHDTLNRYPGRGVIVKIVGLLLYYNLFLSNILSLARDS